MILGKHLYFVTFSMLFLQKSELLFEIENPLKKYIYIYLETYRRLPQ